MGYFSKLDIAKKEENIDHSYHCFEEQLLWRYEDLRDRYLGLLDADAPYVGDDYFSCDDYRYASVEYFTTLRDVWRALEIAKEDLENKCGIVVREDGSVEELDADEEDPDQLTMLEIVLLPTWFQTAAA